jgi:thiol-disulfide isomerase/thioredoxin
MSGRLAVLVGLLAGLLTAGVALAAALVYAPQIADAILPTGRPLPAATAPPTIPPRPTATPVRTVTPLPSPSAGAERSPTLPPLNPSTEPTPSSTEDSLFGVGKKAPKLVLPLLGGGTIDLTKLKGKAVWVNFMGTYCPPCRDEFPQMNVFAARYEDEGLVVLAVDVREEPAVVQAFMDDTGATFQMALDRDGVAQKAWGALALPIHFWIDTDGIVRDGALGAIGPDVMVHGVQTILPGVEVTAP